MLKNNIKLLHLFDILLKLSPFVIIFIAFFQNGWPHRLISLSVIIALLFSLFLDKRINNNLVFYLGVFTFPVLSPFYCAIMGGDYYSYNNPWLQFVDDLNNKALLFVAVSIYISWIFLKIRRYKHVARSVVVVVFKNEIIFLYLISICAFLILFYFAEPGALLTSANKETIIDQRIEGMEFAGGAGSVFFVLSSIIYFSVKNRQSRYWHAVNNYFIISTIVAALWLFLHARRSELVGVLAIYLFNLETKNLRKLIVGCTAILLLIVIGIVRSDIVTLASMLNAFADNSASSTTRYVALPGGAANVYLTFLDGIHYVGQNGFYPGNMIFYLEGFIPTFVLHWFGVKEYFTFSSIVANAYDYNGGLYFPVIFYFCFSFAGCFLLAMCLILFVKLIALASKTNKLSVQMAAYTLFFFSAKMFWYEPIGSGKFVLYAYLIGLFVDKMNLQHKSNSTMANA
jgi:hypothetical protein